MKKVSKIIQVKINKTIKKMLTEDLLEKLPKLGQLNFWTTKVHKICFNICKGQTENGESEIRISSKIGQAIPIQLKSQTTQRVSPRRTSGTEIFPV